MPVSSLDDSVLSHKRNRSMLDANSEGEEAKVIKTNKACLNCRKQKMKCELEGNPPCRRCKNAQVTCLFKVRANGLEAGDWHIRDASTLNVASFNDFKASVNARLHQIESRLGIITSDARSPAPLRPTSRGASTPAEDPDGFGDGEDRHTGLPDLSTPLYQLTVHSRGEMSDGLQSRTVEALWLAFAEHMPALHFNTQRIFNDTPTPILLAAVLYAASMQHTLAEYACLSPLYRRLAARAIAELAIPKEGTQRTVVVEDEDLHDALGIIILGLMCEAWVDTTGIWISMAYQKVLSGAANSHGDKAAEWRSLYQGLKVIDIEHASLRMSCPLLGLTIPLASLQQPILPQKSSQLADQAYTQLTTIMYVGLSQFSGRNLPTIMSKVLEHQNQMSTASPSVPSKEDQAICKGWANQLDAWLARYHRPTKHEQRGPSGANVILLQYQLHKLFVLSIHHSVQGFQVSPPLPGAAELLATARGALQLQRKGMGVWSNWDLVMITYAAILLLDSTQNGEAARNDRLLVQGHINALRTTHQPAPNLRLSLATLLESRLIAATTPPAPTDPYLFHEGSANPFIFNANSESVNNASSSQLNPFDSHTVTMLGSDTVAGFFRTQSNDDHNDINTSFDMAQDLSAWLESTDGFNETFGVPWPRAFQRIMGGLDFSTEQ